jgi:LAO/AO transport system kinase
VLDAWGADVVLVETVGVGQDELEVTRTADTTLVVMAPGMGDEIQAIKAGILECADVFAVNKADREGAETTVRQLELIVALGKDLELGGLDRGTVAGLGHLTAASQKGASVAEAASAVAPVSAPASSPPPAMPEGWTQQIVRCVAIHGTGVAELLQALSAHRAWLTQTEAGQARRMGRLRDAMRQQLRNALLDGATARMADRIEEAVLEVARRETDPYTAAEKLVEAFRHSDGS